MLWLANLEFTAQKATDAYFTADPHAAIWAIQHSIDQHEVAGPAHLLLGTDMPLFMTVSHVRIANLCRRLGDEAGFRRHMDVALTFAEQKAKKPVREEELLETIRIFDEADRKARQPANVPDSEPVTRSPQE